MSSDPKTDLANAEKFIDEWGFLVRFEYRGGNSGSWRVWDGQRWKKDDTEEVMRLVHMTVTKLGHKAVKSGDGALARWAIQSQRIERMRACLSVARTLEGVGVVAGKFDSDSFLLNVLNGTVDLRTGKLRDSNQNDLITKLAPVRYDQNAVSPRWDALLNRVLPDPQVRDYLQAIFGYCLTGDIREECLFFAYGRGSNGKTTIMKPFSVMLGDYAWEANADILNIDREKAQREDVANLLGVRLATVNETKRGRTLNETRAKQLAGKEVLNARHLWEREFQFNPTHKLWVRTNYKPRIEGTDHGLWRRIRLIPFSVEIPPEEIVRDLDQQLIDHELPGILAWAVRGCQRWLKEGLPAPVEVEAATSNWQQESNILADFTENYFQREEGKTSLKSEVYDSYLQWCALTRDKNPMSIRELTSALRDSGFEDGYGAGHSAIWKNAFLRTKAIWTTGRTEQ